MNAISQEDASAGPGPTADELAQLAHEATAPEQHSPGFQYFDKEARQVQRSWRWLFLKSVGLLLFVSLCSAGTGLGPWLVQQAYLPARYLRLFDGVGVGLTLLGVGLEVGLQWHWQRRLSPWTLTRDHAEELRSAVWLYLFDLPPSHRWPSAAAGQLPDPDQVWRGLVQQLAGGHPLRPADEPTAGLRAWRERLRAAGPAEQLCTYQTARLNTQGAYFRRRAHELRAAARQWRGVGYGLLATALLWNLVRLTAIVLDWKAAQLFFNFNLFLVIIGGVALVKAYLDAEDMMPLTAHYQRMADTIQAYVPEPAFTPTPQGVREFVWAAERMLRDETMEWKVRRGEQVPAQAPADQKHPR